MLRLILCLACTAIAAAADWNVGWKVAADQAAKEKKIILADFSGSDWCGGCIMLKKEVFSTPEFAAWAKDKVVLLEVDFPLKTEQPEAVQRENRGLAEKYLVDIFPSVLFLDVSGRELGRLTYMEGGPKVWTAAADAIIGKK